MVQPHTPHDTIQGFPDIEHMSGGLESPNVSQNKEARHARPVDHVPPIIQVRRDLQVRTRDQATLV